MAFVVARNDNRGRRFEIRESALTPAGPRARTLATFRVLSEEVLERAAGRARRPFDRERVVARAASLGVPRGGNPATRAARELLGALHRGAAPARALVGRLRAELPQSQLDLPDSVEPVLAWIGTSDAQRGAALRDLLRLADRIPGRPRSTTLTFPRIRPAGPE